MLSQRGQKLIGGDVELFAIRNDVDAEYTAASLAKQLGANIKPIPVSSEIVGFLDAKKRLEFLADWKATLASGAEVAPAAQPARAMRTAALAAVPRGLTIAVTAAAVLAPLSLIFYQSFLTAPFFDARKTAGLEAYEFIFADPDFWRAFLEFVRPRRDDGRHRGAARRAPRVRDGAHRPSRRSAGSSP